MPYYKLNNSTYNIPDDVVADFEKDNPQATVAYRNGNDIYDIPVSKKAGFLKAFPQASPYDPEGSQPLPERSSAQTSKVVSADLKEAFSTIPRTPRTPRKTLRELARDGQEKKGRRLPGLDELSASLPETPETLAGRRDATSNAATERARQQAELGMRSREAKATADEDRRIDAQFTPRPATSGDNIMANYRDRFLLTERGGQLQREYDQMADEVRAKYLREFEQTPQYKEIAGKPVTTRQEADDANEALNRLFNARYGGLMAREMQPYAEALQSELLDRYGERINQDLAALGKQTARQQLSTLKDDIASLEEENRKSLRRHAPAGANAMNALMGSRSHMQQTEADRLESGRLIAAGRLVEQAEEIMAEAGKKGSTNFVAGTARGIRDNMDWENFTFGLTDMADANLLLSALEKYESRQDLAPAEEALLKAAAVNMAVQGYYASDLGRGYGAGATTAQSLPFMLEFIANPISASGNALAKGLLRFGLKRFGKTAATGAATRAARFVGDATAAAGMTATTGAPRVAAETYERLTENYDYRLDENGDLRVSKTGNTGGTEAFARAATGSFFENQSEMIFNAFRGALKPFMAAVERSVPGGVNTFMRRLGSSRAGQLYRDIKNNPVLREAAERTQFRGFPEEYMEEVYNNFANVAVGNMTLEEAADLDNNIDIALGLVPTQLAFAMLGLGGMATERYTTRRKLERALGSVTDEQRRKMEELLRMSRREGNGDIKQFIRETIADTGLSPEQKRVQMEYAFAVATQRAADDIQQAETDDRVQAEADDIRANSDPQTQTYTECVRYTYDQKGERVEVPGYIVGYMGGQPLWKPAGSTPDTEAVPLREGEYDPASVQSMPTGEAVAETEAMIREDAAAQAERQATYSPRIKPYAGLEAEDEFADGEGNRVQVAARDTDSGLWLMEAWSPEGKLLYSRPVGEQEYLDMAQAGIDRAEAAAKSAGDASKVRTSEAQSPHLSETPPQPSATAASRIPRDEQGRALYEQADPEAAWDSLVEQAAGSEQDAQEIADSMVADMESALSKAEKARPKGTTVDEKMASLKERKAAVEQARANLAAWQEIAQVARRRRQAQEAGQEAERAESQRQVQAGTETEGRHLSAEESERIADEMERNAETAPEVELNAQSWAAAFDENNSIETPVGRVKMGDNQISKFFAKGREKEFGMVAPTLSNPDVIIEEESSSKQGETERPSSYVFVKTFNRNGEKIRFFASITVKKDGLEVSVSSHYMGRNAVIRKMQEGKLIYAKEALSPNSSEWHLAEHRDDVPDLLPTQGNNASSERKDTVSSPEMQEDEAVSSATDMDIARMETPADGRELAAYLLATGHLPLVRQDYLRETGYGEEEARRMIGLFRKPENGGMTIARAGDQLMLADREEGTHFFDQADPNAGRNALLDVLQECRTRGDLVRYIARRRQAEADRFGQLERDAYENYCWEAMHMTTEEYEAYQEYVSENNPYDNVALEELDRIFAEAAEEYQTYLKQQDNGQGTSTNGSETDSGPSERDGQAGEAGNGQEGVPVLPETQPVLPGQEQGRTGGAEEQPGTADDGKRAAQGTVPEGAPGREGIAGDAFAAPKRQEDENLLDYAGRVAKAKEIHDARQEVAASPTDAQKEAGNYKKGHITLDGHDITIENPKGSTRSGVDANGQPWSVTMNNDYGYMRGTEGVDGDHIDVFLSDDPTTGNVFVVDQVDPATGEFDEHKVMYGFSSLEEARAAYLANYSPGWKGLGTISEVGKEEFGKWISSSRRKTKPFIEYRKVRRESAQGEKIKEQSGPVTKIEDVGEKIGGARKDRFKEFAEKEKQIQEHPDSFVEELRKLPVSKIFNFNLEALRKDGLSNEAATLIDVIRRTIPPKPRTGWKLKQWMSDVFGLYRFCLTLATAEQGTFDQVLEKVTNIKKIGGMYRAQMALGGFDSGLDTGQATLEELGESAGHYDKDDNWVSIKGQWYVTKAGRYGGIYSDYENAKESLSKFAGENSKGKEKGTEVNFSIYSYKNSGESFITPKGKPDIVVESGFKSSKEALDYLNEHMDELQAKYRNMKDATSIGFAPNSERRGKDWRGGKDVTAEDFRNAFGFRGVEFGNWANQQERQRALNQAYDAFMDLSEATGISPYGLSLGGELGMAFGARGGGGAAAHYEPGRVVINLTKTQGAGSLAHEWWHAIDNYFSRRRGQALGYNTERKGYKFPVRGGKVEREDEAERKEITNAFTALMKAINDSSYGERSNAYASLKSSYWKKPTELGARAFAVWVERKLSEKGIVNNFLANNSTIGWESPELTQKYYPYPMESDFESLDVAFDNLFGSIEEKVDEETGHTVLYRETDDLSQMNELFNKELQRYQEGQMGKNEMFHLGMPQGVMQMFLPQLPIVMRQRVVKKGSEKKHNVPLQAISDMPSMISDPIFVFQRDANSVGILTDMTDNDGKNVCVAIELGKTIQNGKEYLEVNDIRSFHGREVKYIVEPIVYNNTLRYANKSKGLAWLSSASQQVQQEIDKQDLVSAAKIVENFENPSIRGENLRQGDGSLTDDDLSLANDPVAKMTGRPSRPAARRRAFAERERRRMENAVRELAGKLHLDNVDIVTDAGTLQGQRAKAKGFYSTDTGRITIVLPNHTDVFDAEQTLLHEAVAHYGLRQLFGEHFDTFLYNVYSNADREVRDKIVSLARHNDWNMATATEEYLASLAEQTNFDDLNASWWYKIKELFLQMLHKIGFDDFGGVSLSDNELRYILWRSYENLRQPGSRRSILGQAEDIAKQNELRVGNYAPAKGTTELAAETADTAKAERIRKLRESKPVEITGNEIEASDDLKQYKKNALEYGKKLQGEYTNKDTGITIQLQRGRRNGGINEVLQHDYKDVEHLQSIAAIPQIIENSIYIDSRENIDTDRNPNVKEYQYYVCGLKIGNVDYTVRSTVAVDKNGNRYYDHKLTHVEKGKLLDLINSQAAYNNGFGTTPGKKPTTEIFSGYKDKRLLSILQPRDEENLLFRQSEAEEDPRPASSPTVQAWDKLAGSLAFQLRETAVDYLTAVEKFQELVAGKDIKPFENVYDRMLALSSRNKQEMEMFDSFIANPLNKAILDLVGEKEKIRKWDWDEGPLRQLTMYVEARHGIERNRQMAVEAIARDSEDEASILNEWNAAKQRINNDKTLTWSDKQRRLDKEAANLGADIERDYSGLSSVFGDKNKYPNGWRQAAADHVEQYEAQHAPGLTDNLWQAIRNATGFALRKQLESGLVSREYVERQQARFDNYVPLRGFADEVAGDVYNYMEGEFSPAANPVKKAEGRTSEAGNPFAGILSVAYASIAAGNKNLAKQTLYALVANHDTGGLAVVNRAWMVRRDRLHELEGTAVQPQTTTATGTDWVEAVPVFPKKPTEDDISQALRRFGQEMERLQREGAAQTVDRKAKVAFRTLHGERDEHDIPLYVGGEKRVITITGNPRLAQAMNGLLNPDVNNDALTRLGKRVQAFMAGAFTARNPAFALANLFRDSIYANNQAFIRENPRYWLNFTRNQRLGILAYPAMWDMLARYRSGKLDTGKKDERLFKEFMDNGGATGYTFVNTQDEYTRELARKLKQLSRKTPEWFTPKGTLSLLFDLVEFAGQSAELVNRFAAYKTGREMGRPVSRSIRDAKEITVNFNRKGAGRKSADKDKSWYSPINIASALSQAGRAHILFWNANMQGKYRLYKNLREHPLKTSASLIGGCMAWGGIWLPLLNNLALPAFYAAMGLGGDGDDEEAADYFDALTDWERTHNLCIRLPQGSGWLKVPLSPDMAPWMSLGDLVHRQLTGRWDISAADYSKSLADALSPMSVNWSYEGWDMGLNFTPTVGQPLWQAMLNVNFMGNPLHKEPLGRRQQFVPQYRMVYRNASPTLVALSRLSNRLTGGTDLKTSGWADWNPATVQNLLRGYAGGYATTLLSVADWIVGTASGEKQAASFSRMPLVGRFYIAGDKEMDLRRLGTSFRQVERFVDEFEYDRKAYMDAATEARRSGDLMRMAEYLDKLRELEDSDRAKKYVRLKAVCEGTKGYEEYLEEFPGDEATRNLLYRMKAEGLRELRKEEED